jgi:hypothetical protein
MGEQALIEAGQSLLSEQTAQDPRTQCGLPAGHASSFVHSTQPRSASHTAGGLHPAAQRPPVSTAPLDDGAESFPPPQAIGTKMSAGTMAASEKEKRRIMDGSPREMGSAAMVSEDAVNGPLFGTMHPAGGACPRKALARRSM